MFSAFPHLPKTFSSKTGLTGAISGSRFSSRMQNYISDTELTNAAFVHVLQSF